MTAGSPSMSVDEEIQRRVDEAVAQRIAVLEATFDDRLGRAIARRIFKPRLPPMNQDGAPFMPYSSCSAADFLHPRYHEICAMLCAPPVLHRKMWEWVFVVHHLLRSGVVGAGRRGLVFGVGNEALPAFFAGRGANVVATDAPPQIGQAAGWVETGQHAASRDILRQPSLCADGLFDDRVTYRYCDMNAIDADLSGFDFTWSSCCFEHLGSLDAGMQFVINSVERCLKPGGVAVHTTELNVSSDDATIDLGPTVLYRRRDMLRLVETLRERGHEVQPFIHAPDAHTLDFHVDVAPYVHDPHIKLEIGAYVSTSVGIVVRRGPL